MRRFVGNTVYRFAAVFTSLFLYACVTVPQGNGTQNRSLPVVDVAKIGPEVERKSRYGNPSCYEVYGKRYHVLPTSRGYSEVGIASWYGREFQNRRTSSGECYDLYKMTAAHKTLPLPTYAKVTNLRNGKQVVVKINDRGPFVKNRLIDLSYAAAKQLGITTKGTERVRVDVIDPFQAMQQLKSEPMVSHHVYLQLGTYRDFYNARRVLFNARHFSQLPCKIYLNNKFDKAVVYQVRIGPVRDVDTAKQLAAMMQSAGFPRPAVIT
jgi:rare lipoprotein A